MRVECDTNYVHIKLGGDWSEAVPLYIHYKVDPRNQTRTILVNKTFKNKDVLGLITSERGRINWKDFMERNGDDFPSFIFWKNI
jgi:hypothetical protein